MLHQGQSTNPFLRAQKLMLRRLLRMLLTGTFIFIGMSCALASFGVIETWGVFTAPRPLLLVAAVIWFGVGGLTFGRSNG